MRCRVNSFLLPFHLLVLTVCDPSGLRMLISWADTFALHTMPLNFSTCTFIAIGMQLVVVVFVVLLQAEL